MVEDGTAHGLLILTHFSSGSRWLWRPISPPAELQGPESDTNQAQAVDSPNTGIRTAANRAQKR